MSNLREIQAKLADTAAALAQTQDALSRAPSSFALQLSVDSISKRQRELEVEFLKATEEASIQVCSYRIFEHKDRQIKLGGVSSALGDFQTAFSVIFDAEKNGPKQTAKLAADLAEVTSFNFAYSFQGSVGVVLTLPAERLLFGESDFDRSISTLFALVNARSSEEIRDFARRLGRGPIRSVYKWVAGQVRFGLGADIDWRRGDKVLANVFVEYRHLLDLQIAIDRTSDITEEHFDAEAELVGVDVPQKRFHLKMPTGEDVRGLFDDAVSESHVVQLPSRYVASLTKTTRVKYSTEEEETTFFLRRLSPA